MNKVIKLNEQDLKRLVKESVEEQTTANLQRNAVIKSNSTMMRKRCTTRTISSASVSTRL